MRKSIAILATALLSVSAFAQGAASCEAQATERKLAGAAKTSFLKKCEREAGASQPDPAKVCEAQAAEKKLAGAAKTSFVTKCVKDAAAK